ncbi:MAG: hypothetical protein OXR73_08375 [Myxococcales bacterium]|nr:hypothetical protein [Myxococcales bacterium]
MLICMRTTVVIDDAILRQAKQEAARAGCTLSDLVNQALRVVLSKRKEPRPEFHMVVYGSRCRTAHEPDDFNAALEADDIESLAR